MKNFYFLMMFSLSFLFAQNNNSKIFSKSEFGIYSGVNFDKTSNLGSTFIFEGKTNITSKINMKLSFGYSIFSNPQAYNFQTYEVYNIENIKRYISISYKVNEVEYQVIPFSLGFQYNFINDLLSPYLQIETNYKLIDPVTSKTDYKRINEYDSFDDLPEVFKRKDILPISSLGFSFGFGTKHKISSILNIDIRYLYEIDNELVDKHLLIVGLTI